MARIAVLMLAGGLVFVAARWLLGRDDPEPQQGPVTAVVAEQPAQPPPARMAPPFPVPDPVPWLPIPPGFERGAVASLPAAPAAPPPEPPKVEAPSRTTAAGSGFVASVDATLPPQQEERQPEQQAGKLTFRGSLTYQPPGDPPPRGRGRVTLAGTMDCNDGTGSLYYRDPTQRVEWQSSTFRFDVNAACLTEREQLEALVDDFNISVVGTYSPLTRPALAEVAQDGRFAFRLASSDAAGIRLQRAMLCLALQDGVFGRYTLPQNIANPHPTAGCTSLDTFAIQRSRPPERGSARR